MNRRQFLKLGASGLALSGLRFAPTTFAAAKARRVAVIGSGWYGKSNLFRLLQVEPVELVAICDVDKRMAAEAAAMVAARQASRNRPRTWGDFRQMLREEKPELVLVATPDHWHALAMIGAVEAGADVMVEKPTGVDVVEGQAMVAAARKHGRVVQVHTQRRSTPHLIEAREILREGKLGKIALVEIYCYYHMRANDNPPDCPPPANLDYEMWTGPAPMRPFNPLVHPRRWRAFMEYGNGIVGDMCVHMFDMVRWMLDLGWPKRIASSGGILVNKNSRANITDTQTVTFDFGDLEVIWQHRAWGDPPDPAYPWGATFYGENGTLKASVLRYDFTPLGEKTPARHGEALYEYDKYPEDKTEKDLERHVASAMRAHWRNLLQAIETRGRPVADIEQGHISSSACILANVAQKLGRTLTWDPVAGKVFGDDEANGLLARPYRAPWIHPRPETV